MDLMQPEVATAERTDLQSRTLTPPPTRGLTESTDTVRVLSDRGFTAIYGTRSAEALTAFNADAVQRGPGAALDQLAERPGAYAPGVEASPTSRALAGALRLGVPGTETRTEGQTVAPDGLSVNGVSTKTPFPKEVGSYETQEMVLQRAYEEYAARAGISNMLAPGQEPGDQSPRDTFVNDRIVASRGAENDARIYNPATSLPYTAAEWAGFQERGTITMYPTDADIVALERAKQQSSRDDGARAAENVLGALKNYEEFSLAGALGITNPEASLKRAMDTLDVNAADPYFQRGFVSYVQADGFLRLSKALDDNPAYGRMLTRALSETTRISGTTPEVAVEIARTADPATLARLTSSPAYPMGTDFLVAAGQRVMTRDVGWSTVIGANSPGPSVRINKFEPGTQDLMQRIAQDPDASLRLLQDADFVRNATVLENSENGDGLLARVVASGLSVEGRQRNSGQTDDALRVLSEVLQQPETVQGLRNGGLSTRDQVVSESLAVALASAYATNTSRFTAAAGIQESVDGGFDGRDFRTLMAAIQPYASVRDPKTGLTLDELTTAATAREYTRLLDEAVTKERPTAASVAGRLAGAYVDGMSRANTDVAKLADARQERLAKYISIAAELGTAGLLGEATGVLTEVVSKTVATETELGMKGNSADRADARNDKAFDRQISLNRVAVLGAFERNAYARATSPLPDQTDEQRTQREQAKQDIRDLQAYNADLPEGQKILNGNGRLKNAVEANAGGGLVRIRMQHLFSNEGPTERAREAAGRLNMNMSTLQKNMDASIVEQIKR